MSNHYVIYNRDIYKYCSLFGSVVFFLRVKTVNVCIVCCVVCFCIFIIYFFLKLFFQKKKKNTLALLAHWKAEHITTKIARTDAKLDYRYERKNKKIIIELNIKCCFTSFFFFLLFDFFFLMMDLFFVVWVVCVCFWCCLLCCVVFVDDRTLPPPSLPLPKPAKGWLKIGREAWNDEAEVFSIGKKKKT